LPGPDVYKIFDVERWLHLNSKPDNKCVNCEDIILVSEIITNSRYWQDAEQSINFASGQVDITALIEVLTISI
jgi:hypothetical protein